MTRRELIDLCLALPHTYEDYPFDEVADANATTVMRHRANKKSFALIMRHKEQLYLNLKCEPMEADFLRQVYEGVMPGYHMNKTHWNTVVIGSDVPESAMRMMIERSYALTKPKVRKGMAVDWRNENTAHHQKPMEPKGRTAR